MVVRMGTSEWLVVGFVAFCILLIIGLYFFYKWLYSDKKR